MDTIQSIEKIRSLFKVTLDNGQQYWLPANAFSKTGYSPGTSLDHAAWIQAVLICQYRPALNRAVSMLAARDCSRGEIRKKLLSCHYAEETVDMVLLKLEQNKLLNDTAFAASWARMRIDKLRGPNQIIRELRMKGISAEESDAALNNINKEELLDAAVHYAEKMIRKTNPDEPTVKTRQRLLCALVRRGFDWDDAREALNRVFSE